MFGLLKPKPVLDAEAADWLFDAYAWSLAHFGSDVFREETLLVVPSNEHFPGRADSVHGMASLIFAQVQGYAGMAHWPWRLLDQTACHLLPPPKAVIRGALRGSTGIAAAPADVTEAHRLVVTYNPHQIGEPEALIASYAYALAHYLGSVAQEPPPGGEALRPQATELLAIFMGFGLMFANTAYTFKRGCGSCYNPRADRAAALSQDEATYALALFCTLKQIPNRQVLRHLRSHLRPLFKNSVREIGARRGDLARLHGIDRPLLQPA